MNTRPTDVMPCDRCPRLKADLDEMRRRRDEWRKKAEGYDAVRLALREIPAQRARDRADDAEAALAGFADALVREAKTCTEMAERARVGTAPHFHQGEAFALRDVARRIRAGEFPKEGE